MISSQQGREKFWLLQVSKEEGLRYYMVRGVS